MPRMTKKSSSSSAIDAESRATPCMQGPAPSSPSSKESAVFTDCFRGAGRASLSSTPTSHLLGSSSAAQMQTRNQIHRLKIHRCLRLLRVAVPDLAPHRPNRILVRHAASRATHGSPASPASGRVSKATKRSRPTKTQSEWVETASDGHGVVWKCRGKADV